MSFIKTAFIIALINFFGVVSIVAITPLIKSERETESLEDSIPVITSTPTPSLTVTATLTPTVATTKKPTASPTVSSTPKPTPTTDPLAGKCIIYISGTRYDVTDFRNIHSGGDIFQCGTDMTDIFRNQHPDSYLSRMDKYKI